MKRKPSSTSSRTSRRLVGAVPVQPTASRRSIQQEVEATTRTRSRKHTGGKIATREQQRDAEADRRRGEQRLPQLDAATARDVAKLLLSGVPFTSVLALCNNSYASYIAGMRDEQEQEQLTLRWLRAWQRDPLLLSAMSELNGAEWQDIDSERRLQVALDKHMAELAYFLYSHSYATLAGRDVDKADSARTAIMEFLAAKGGDPDAPWMKHLKDLVDRVGLDHAVPMLTVPTTDASGKDVRS